MRAYRRLASSKLYASNLKNNFIAPNQREISGTIALVQHLDQLAADRRRVICRGVRLRAVIKRLLRRRKA